MPKRAEVTPRQQDLLQRARYVTEQREHIEQAYVEAIMACLDAGITKAEIGRAVGVTAENIRQIERRRS